MEYSGLTNLERHCHSDRAFLACHLVCAAQVGSKDSWRFGGRRTRYPCRGYFQPAGSD